MGTGGSNALIETIENPQHIATNDGASILAAIRLADPIEEMGRKILLEAVSRANKQSGDGSSTTSVLTAAIIEEGVQHLGQASAMDIKRSLEACIPVIEAAIMAQKRDITVHEVGAVASISAEDESIGALIQEIYEKIGADGIIHWDISKTSEDTYSIGNGITIEGAGFASPYMADMDEKTSQFTNVARWKNPKVLITKQKITSAADFNDLFAAMFNRELKEVVVFCDEYEPMIIPDLIKTRAVRGFKTLLIKMPVLWKDEWYADLAAASGATIIDPAAGIGMKDARIEHLGTFGNIVVDKEDTFIDGIQDLTEHIATIEAEGTDEAQNRAARLNTKTARLYVGAHSDSALSYKRLKVEDAISAAWQALHGGVVIGGGLALSNVGLSLDNPILKVALTAPTLQISTNMGSAFTEEDMVAQNVYDPANVVVNAAKNAISVAAAVLTAKSVVLLPREEYMPYPANMPVVR